MFRMYLIVTFLMAGASAMSNAQTPSAETKGVINATDCGSVATLVETRVIGCDALHCDLTPQSQIETDYFLRTDIPNAQMRFTATPTGKVPIVEIKNLGYLRTSQYVQTLYPLGYTDFFTSQEVTIKVEVMTFQHQVELCVSGLFNQGRVDPTTTTDNPTTTTATGPTHTGTTPTAIPTTPGSEGGGVRTTSASIGMVSVLLCAMLL